MSPKKFSWMVIVVTIAAISLAGCFSKPCCVTTPCNTGCCKSTSQNNFSRFNRCIKRSWEQRFQAVGVQLIQVGDDVKFVLPSDSFFCAHTATLNRSRYPVLDMIAAFMCGLQKMNVKVSGYTDCGDCHVRNLALSRQQAQTLADYLSRQGIDARLLYAVGYGECVPIACNETCKGQASNRRVEITFRKITDDYDT